MVHEGAMENKYNTDIHNGMEYDGTLTARVFWNTM
jgi:hypothetical protein